MTTTMPIALEVARGGQVKQIRIGSENVQGTLFDRALSKALKPLQETPLPAGVSAGTHSLYVLWFTALKLKLHNDWKEPAHAPGGGWEAVIPDLWQGRARVSLDRRQDVARLVSGPWEEPAHWFDPGSLIIEEESVLISALDEIYPELRLAERVSFYRRGTFGAPPAQEAPIRISPEIGVNKQLVIRALTNPEFRRMLSVDPQKALGVAELSDARRKEISFVLATVKTIDFQIESLADELLCAKGGGGPVVG